MLKLQLDTDPHWANLAERNLQEVMTDHAFCEQKAASYAISLIVLYPDRTELVEAMSALAREEMEHFQQVHERMVARGWKLGKERADSYVRDLKEFFKDDRSGDRKKVLVNRLLLAAMIEARSCERFKTLSENLEDEELAHFYRDLMASEANHYTMFLKFARQYGDGIDVDALWAEFLVYEAQVITNYGKKEWVHG